MKVIVEGELSSKLNTSSIKLAQFDPESFA